MRNLLVVSVLIASFSAFAEARDVQFQKWVNKLSRLDSTTDEGKLEGSDIAGAIEARVIKFADRAPAKRNVSEFQDLVTLVAFASPFLSFPDIPQAVIGLKKDSPQMAEAFDRGFAGVDSCRQQRFMALANDGDNEQDGPAAAKNVRAKTKEFSYAKCVAATKSSTKSKK